MSERTPFPARVEGAQPQIPEVLSPTPEGVFLAYQKRAINLLSTTALAVIEKSRRIGLTWAVAAYAVLQSAKKRSARGQDTLYIGYNLDMAREFIDTCGMWAKAFNYAGAEIDEFLFEDSGPESDPDKYIKAYRITFASGFEIMALSSKPRSLRGRQGLVIIDEAAFHDDLGELLKAALAMLVWGGQVVIVSTHDGADNAFNELINEIRAKKRPGEVMRIDFDDALKDGLCERVCLVTGQEYSEEFEEKWRQEIIDFYSDAADEELFCIPRRGGGAPLSRAIIEACMDDAIPVLRWNCPDGFALKGEVMRTKEARDWWEENVLPYIEKLDPTLPSVFGEDFGRVSDLTDIWPMQITQNLFRHTPFIIELRNVPFEQQKEILFDTVDLLPRFRKGALDAGGNGAYLAEVAWQRYGASRIEKVPLSNNWYLENMPPYVSAWEDQSLDAPKDSDIVDDHRSLKRIEGIIKLPSTRTKGADKKMRHGDSAIAGALSWYASCLDAVEIDYKSTGQGRRSVGAYRDQNQRLGPGTDRSVGFGVVRGRTNMNGYH